MQIMIFVGEMAHVCHSITPVSKIFKVQIPLGSIDFWMTIFLLLSVKVIRIRSEP